MGDDFCFVIKRAKIPLSTEYNPRAVIAVFWYNGQKLGIASGISHVGIHKSTTKEEEFKIDAFVGADVDRPRPDGDQRWSSRGE